MSPISLSQPQREALIQIFVLGMYSDNHLSLAEDESLDQFLDSIAWDSGTGRTVVVSDAITEVTNISNDIDLADYIERNAAAFHTAESRAAALEALTEFLKVDGLTAAEGPLLAKISQALGN